MKKIFITTTLLLCGITGMQAQQKFNVQNGTKTEFYNDLETAIEKAVSGDTIYLPGQPFRPQTNIIVIDKKLAIIGAGCDVDSIGGLQTTEIIYVGYSSNYASVVFNEGSDGSLLMGCIINGISFEENKSINNITITRNFIDRTHYCLLKSS